MSPSQQQVTMVILLMILLKLCGKRASPLQSTLYASNGSMTIEGLLSKPGDCRNLLLFEPHVFLHYVVADLLPHIHL